MEELLKSLMYEAPSDETISRITITADAVKGEGEPIVERANLRKRIRRTEQVNKTKKKSRRNPA